MAIEFGARTGIVAPDDTTFEYLAGRDFAPRGTQWDRAVAHWRGLPSDEAARFDAELALDVAALDPQVSWGTSVDQVVPITGRVPGSGEGDAGAFDHGVAHDYIGLAPGTPIEGVAIDWAFIGSCANGRLGDLRSAAAIMRGRKVAPGVRALVVPGSTAVRRAAEREGLDKVFTEAGAEWREAGCSLCCAVNGDSVGSGERCISTSNRNFIGRQGPGSRTHLASPSMVAAAAVTGCITEVRRLAQR
jgi:3-isopropylmalate/(R)-2-methylmalate dehydratase large subunit